MIQLYYLQFLTGVAVTLFKETFTLIALLTLMFYHDWQLSLLAMIMIPVAAISSKNIGKKNGQKSPCKSGSFG
jgi:ATP-binding cassette, subfamily B, bacterial MsbA